MPPAWEDRRGRGGGAPSRDLPAHGMPDEHNGIRGESPVALTVAAQVGHDETPGGNLRYEPDAVVPHVRVCADDAGQPASGPRMWERCAEPGAVCQIFNR